MREAWVSPIVVGFDGSADSVRAFDWALAEAGVRDGAVRDKGDAARGGRIVVSIDGPVDCDTALAFAFQEAARREGTVRAVHAFDEAAVQTVAYLEPWQPTFAPLAVP